MVMTQSPEQVKIQLEDATEKTVVALPPSGRRLGASSSQATVSNRFSLIDESKYSAEKLFYKERRFSRAEYYLSHYEFE